VAFQAYCLERIGVTVNRVCLMRIENRYVLEGEIDPRGLFHVEDVTEEIDGKVETVPGAVERMLRAIGRPNPDIPIGAHCDKPYKCNLRYLCWDFLPRHSVTELRRGKRKAFQFISEGIYDVVDAPAERLTDRQLIQQNVVTNGQPYIEPVRIHEWLAELEFPLYCFDFETIFPALPIFNGTRPYQHVPFQFSLHVLRDWGATPEHHEFLASDAADPRPALVVGLRAIGPTGNIVAYNMGFERRRIHELTLDFPQHGEFLEGLVERFRDLATPFEQFWYYHPDQNGSCSLKSVLPVLTGKTYDELQIGRGDDAAREFLRVVHGDASTTEREGVLASLREYCKQDTKALVEILHALRGMI
jgi:hypothetical protein